MRKGDHLILGDFRTPHYTAVVIRDFASYPCTNNLQKQLYNINLRLDINSTKD